MVRSSVAARLDNDLLRRRGPRLPRAGPVASRRDRAARWLKRVFVTGYPYRTLFGWIAALALAWLALSSPCPATWNLLLAAFTVGLALLAIIVATRRVRARQSASHPVLQAIDASLDGLPRDIRRNTPLV